MKGRERNAVRFWRHTRPRGPQNHLGLQSPIPALLSPPRHESTTPSLHFLCALCALSWLIPSPMKNIFAVSSIVIKELCRRKDFYVLFILTVLIFLVMGSVNVFNDHNVIRYLKE